MKNVNLTRIVGAVAVFALALFFVNCSHVHSMGKTEDVETRSFDVAAGGTLTMDVSGASIEIKTGNSNTIDVKVIKKARTNDKAKAERMFKDYKIDYDHSGDDLTIESKNKRKKSLLTFGRNYVAVRFILTIPEKYNLDLYTSGGSISVADLTGRVKAKTSGGSIKMQDCTGDVDVKTSGGSIRIGKVEGEVEAHTSGGSITVEEVMGTVNAKTSGGSVSATITKQPKGDCSLKTSGGSIKVKLAGDIKVDLDAATSGGSVSTDFPVMVKGKRSKRKLKTEINGGGPELYLRTSGGSVRINKID